MANRSRDLTIGCFAASNFSGRPSPVKCPRRSVTWQRACLGRALSDSNSSIAYFDFSVFSAIWGICFSLKANPNGMKRSDSGTLVV